MSMCARVCTGLLVVKLEVCTRRCYDELGGSTARSVNSPVDCTTVATEAPAGAAGTIGAAMTGVGKGFLDLVAHTGILLALRSTGLVPVLWLRLTSATNWNRFGLYTLPRPT